MKTLFVAATLLASTFNCFSMTNAEVKKQLKIEITALKSDLVEAQNSITALNQDKQSIQNGLDQMKQWGIDQQNQAIAYYNESLEAKKELTKEKAEHQKTKDKYTFIKKFFGLICGFLFAILSFMFYTKIEASPQIQSVVALGGIYGRIISMALPILVPFLAFVFGFCLIWIPF